MKYNIRQICDGEGSVVSGNVPKNFLTKLEEVVRKTSELPIEQVRWCKSAPPKKTSLDWHLRTALKTIPVTTKYNIWTIFLGWSKDGKLDGDFNVVINHDTQEITINGETKSFK